MIVSCLRYVMVEFMDITESSGIILVTIRLRSLLFVWMKACNLIKQMLATNETARPTAKDPPKFDSCRV